LITAVDTNILLDVLTPGSKNGPLSAQALTESVRAGALVICEAVYAELSVTFGVKNEIDRFLGDVGIRLANSTEETLFTAGTVWSRYLGRRTEAIICPRCGSRQQFRCDQCGQQLTPRQHLVTDFLIGAHALNQADRLLSRDLGYYRTYFEELVVESS
jgi:predicted nucleic acid-binding protein